MVVLYPCDQYLETVAHGLAWFVSGELSSCFADRIIAGRDATEQMMFCCTRASTSGSFLDMQTLADVDSTAVIAPQAMTRGVGLPDALCDAHRRYFSCCLCSHRTHGQMSDFADFESTQRSA